MKKIALLALILSSAFIFTSCITTDIISAIDAYETYIDDNSAIEELNPTAQKIFKTVEVVHEEYYPEDEYEIGRSVAATISNKYDIYTDAPGLTMYLNKICQTIVENSNAPNLYNGYRVAIIDSDEINALSTPGGHIFISRGLIACSDSEDALAAIIAHEIAHIQLKHGVGAIKTNKLVNIGISIGKDMASSVAKKHNLNKRGISDKVFDSFISSVSVVAETLINSGFSQDQEFKADEEALKLMADAGYDPVAMIEMLEHLPCTDRESSLIEGWNKTHPAPEERIRNAEFNLIFLNISVSDKYYRIPRYENEINGLK